MCGGYDVQCLMTNYDVRDVDLIVVLEDVDADMILDAARFPTLILFRHETYGSWMPTYHGSSNLVLLLSVFVCRHDMGCQCAFQHCHNFAVKHTWMPTCHGLLYLVLPFFANTNAALVFLATLTNILNGEGGK